MPLTGKEMLKLLKRNGGKELRQEGSHHILEKDGVMRKRSWAENLKRYRTKEIVLYLKS